MREFEDVEPMTSELRARVLEMLVGGGTVLDSMTFDEARQSAGHYTPPAPPPADMCINPEKWRALDRKTRRALLRHHRKVTG